MTTIDEKIATSTTQLQDELDSNFETFAEGQTKIKADIDANKIATTKNSETIANALETLDTDVQKLAEKIDASNGGTSTFTTCEPIKIDNSKLHPKVASLKHIVGFETNLECADGYFRDGPVKVTCFPSGKYCESSKFGKTSCDDSELPSCKPCDDSTCKICAGGPEQCTLCKKADQIPVVGGTCRDSFASCKAMYDAGKLKKEDGATEVSLFSPKPDGQRVRIFP